MPTALFTLYGAALGRMVNKEIDWDSDTIVATLHTSGYTPDLVAHDYVDDLTSELSSTSGYTVGGKTLGTKTNTLVAANSWAQVAAVSTAYAVGEIRRPSVGNGWVYRVSVAGTSSSSAPTWPTVVGTTVTDGSVVWENVGRAVVMLDAADIVWNSASFTSRRLVLSDRQAGSASAQPLIAVCDFGSDQVAGGGDFTVQFDAGGIITLFVA